MLAIDLMNAATEVLNAVAHAEGALLAAGTAHMPFGRFLKNPNLVV
jgi:hypothetical protein